MKEDNKLLDAIIDLGMAVKELRSEVNELRGEMKGMRKEMKGMQKEQHKTNIILAEHSRSIIKLAEQQKETNINMQGLRSDFNKYANYNNLKVNQHEKRIIRLEDTTFGKDAQRVSKVKEPNAEYKKKKKN